MIKFHVKWASVMERRGARLS